MLMKIAEKINDYENSNKSIMENTVDSLTMKTPV